MIKLTLENIQKYLTDKGITTQTEASTNQLFVMMKYDSLEYPLFARVYDKDTLLQLLLFIPCSIKAGSEPDLARLLLLINKEIDIPGFGMDETSSVVFYRIMIPTFNMQLEEGLIGIYLEAFESIARAFSMPIMAVASGKSSYQNILKQLKASAGKV